MSAPQQGVPVIAPALVLSLALASQAVPVNPRGVSHVELSQHFALRWGDALVFPPEVRARVLASLERAWLVFMDDLGHPAPAGSDEHLLNVYLGDSGEGAPPGYGYAYATEGPEGIYVVISPIALEWLDVLDASLAHELYHTLQASTGHHTSSRAGWYWEATAEWAAHLVFPDDPLAGTQMAPIMALLPHVGLTTFLEDAEPEDLAGFHQYAAGLFPIFLTDELVSPLVIRDSWESPAAPQDPLASLDALLVEEGTSLRQAWLSFAAHTATWDLEDGAVLEAVTESYAAGYPDQDHRVAATVPAAGALGIRPGAGLEPQRFAFNVVEIAVPGSPLLDVVVTPDLEGSEGSPPELVAMAVTVEGELRTYTEASAEGSLLSVAVDAPSSGRLLVVVAAVGEAAPGERFGYTVEALLREADAEEPSPSDPPTEEEPADTPSEPATEVRPDAPGAGRPVRSDGPTEAGCCSAGPAPTSAAPLALGLALAAWRTRRRRGWTGGR